MPTIGSLSGAFGWGRSPQLAPPPGFTIYPPIGTKSNWSFSANGAFSFRGNIAVDAATAYGNAYVITPVSTFFANIKVWGAGGGGIGNINTTSAMNVLGAAGGHVSGKMLFRAGQPYTVFAGANGYDEQLRGFRYGTSGGAASGILLGNIYQSSGQLLPEVCIAGGGGGTMGGTNPFRLPGAGGGNNVSQVGETITSISYSSSYPTDYQSARTSGKSGDGSNSVVSYYQGSWALHQYGATAAYAGGGRTFLTSINGTNSGGVGGGGGGHLGGPVESGGQGYVDPEYDELTSYTGVWYKTPGYDYTFRGNAGDPGMPGKAMIIFDDEYAPANITATGGTVTEVPIPGKFLAYRYHTFTSNGKFSVTSVGGSPVVDIFAVGGGGGAGTLGGGGGGAVSVKTNQVITTGNYIVSVGAGGLGSDSYSEASVGGTYGGFKGGDSVVTTNQLASKGFPDNYWKLINSFNSPIRYISLTGDDTDGLTLTTGYLTIESAIAKNNSNPDLMVFVIMAGTYEPVVDAAACQTPIADKGQPRIFVCCPGKVIINSNPVPASTQRDAPMATLENPLSAIYGAIIVRNMFDAGDDISQTAFFNQRSDPGDRRARGNFYNCAFKENAGKWSFVYGPATVSDVSFKLENCTFVTKDTNLSLTGVNSSSDSKVLVKNCVFNKPLTTTAALVNCGTSLTVTTKYAVAGVTDKGVFAGDYGWAGAISIPERTVTPITIVARGGGGASSVNFATFTRDENSDVFGGCSPGSHNNVRQPFLQANPGIEMSYSSYSNPGGYSVSGYGPGGGGAASPGINALASNTIGGVGMEWPSGTGIFYGGGGSGIDVPDISTYLNGTVGKGGSARTDVTNTIRNGCDGLVAFRYIVPGPYTEAPPEPTRNIVATGGLTRATPIYTEHTFTSSGLFSILMSPTGPNYYFDIIAVGGGGGGSGNGHYSTSNPGHPGAILYRRVYITGSASNLYITIGGGGVNGTYHGDVNGHMGGTTSIVGPAVSVTAPGGDGGKSSYDWNAYQNDGQRRYPSGGTLVRDGLFDDNNQFYGAVGGANGGGRSSPLNYGSRGTGGSGSYYDGWDDPGSDGFPGVVIIRYPTYPIS